MPRKFVSGRMADWYPEHPSYYKTIYIYPALKQIFSNALLTCEENNESSQRPKSKWNGILKGTENLKLKKYWWCQLLATTVGGSLTWYTTPEYCRHHTVKLNTCIPHTGQSQPGGINAKEMCAHEHQTSHM